MLHIFDVSEQLVERLAEEWLVVHHYEPRRVTRREYRVVAIIGQLFRLSIFEGARCDERVLCMHVSHVRACSLGTLFITIQAPS